MQEEAELCRIPFQRGFVWTQQPQIEEAGAHLFGTTQTDKHCQCGTDQTLEISSRFSNVSGRVLPSGPGVIAFC